MLGRARSPPSRRGTEGSNPSPSQRRVGSELDPRQIMTAPAMTPSHIRRITSRLRAVSAAQNITPSLLLYTPVRWFLNILRGVDSFIFALLFVAAVGLGPFAGVIGIGLHFGRIDRQAMVGGDRVGQARSARSGGAHGGQSP